MPFLMRSGLTPATHAGPPPASVLNGDAEPSAMGRRREVRRRADQNPGLSAQLIGAVDVRLCDVSTRGAMFESSMRLLVGTRVRLRLRTGERVVTVPGTVARCCVSATGKGRLRFETAVVLDQPFAAGDEPSLTPADPRETVSVVSDLPLDADALRAGTLVNQW